MEYRTLGRTGLRVSAVALGCEGFMHKRAEEVKADFDFAIGHGINFVDIYRRTPTCAPTSVRRSKDGAGSSSSRATSAPYGRTTNTCARAIRRRAPTRSNDSCGNCAPTISTWG